MIEEVAVDTEDNEHCEDTGVVLCLDCKGFAVIILRLLFLVGSIQYRIGEGRVVFLGVVVKV